MVNVKDFQAPAATSCRLTAMFDRQYELAVKYLPIESRNNCLETSDIPVNMLRPEGQKRAKWFWCMCMEELSEAALAVDEHPDDVLHMQEEVIDALHFLIEMFLMMGKDPQFFKCERHSGEILEGLYPNAGIRPDPHDPHWKRMFGETIFLFHKYMGGAMNCLKQKPWKQDHKHTDQERFHDFLREGLQQFWLICATAGLKADDVYDLYFRKSEVNKFRQRSNY